jgi:hypothetical protein
VLLGLPPDPPADEVLVAVPPPVPPVPVEAASGAATQICERQVSPALHVPFA